MAATGNTMESLLNQLPGVWASNSGISVNGKSGISVNGKSGITVYVNDRPVNLQGEALMKYLHNLRSEDIAKIEIMQSASAEYSVEGAGGVIRIITKRIINEGYRGAVSATALYQNYPGIIPYFGVQYGKDKFGAQFSFSGEKSKWLSYMEDCSQDLVNGTNYNETGTDTISDLNWSTSLTLNYDFDHYNKLVVNAYYLYWGKDEHIGKLTEISGNRPDNISSTQNDHKAEQDMYELFIYRELQSIAGHFGQKQNFAARRLCQSIQIQYERLFAIQE
jgi:outer membrane cobalamin receptor